MVQFADVLTQVGADTVSEDALRRVRVNTSGWDSWLAQDPETKAPAPGSFYLDAEALATEMDEAAGPAPDADPLPEAGEATALPRAGSPAVEPNTRRALDLASELAETRLQLLTEPELRALRRRLARHVHPDAPVADRPDAGDMVRVNVAIDTALRARRSRPQRR